MKQTKTGGKRDEQVLIDLLEDTLEKDTGAKSGITVNRKFFISIWSNVNHV